MNLGWNVDMICKGDSLIKYVFSPFTALKLRIQKYIKRRNMNLGPAYYYRKTALMASDKN